MQKLVFNIIIIVLLYSSCSKIHKHNREIVENLVGKEIIFPKGMKFQIVDSPFEYDFDDSDYKIITNIDSIGCTSGNMKLTIWKDTIDDFKPVENKEVNFLMLISSKNLDEVLQLLKSANFKHPVVIDTEGEFNKFNEIPKATPISNFLT